MPPRPDDVYHEALVSEIETIAADAGADTVRWGYERIIKPGHEGMCTCRECSGLRRKLGKGTTCTAQYVRNQPDILVVNELANTALLVDAKTLGLMSHLHVRHVTVEALPLMRYVKGECGIVYVIRIEQQGRDDTRVVTGKQLLSLSPRRAHWRREEDGVEVRRLAAELGVRMPDRQGRHPLPNGSGDACFFYGVDQILSLPGSWPDALEAMINPSRTFTAASPDYEYAQFALLDNQDWTYSTGY